MNSTHIVTILDRGTGLQIKLSFTSQEDLYSFLNGFDPELENEDTKPFKEGKIYALQNYFPIEVKEEIWEVLPIHEVLHAAKAARKDSS